MKNIYLAGKVNHTDYRQTSFDLNRLYQDVYEGEVCQSGAYVKYSPENHQRYIDAGLGGLFGLNITGPFFIGCDHGCAHGSNQHGSIFSSYYTQKTMTEAQFNVFHNCIESIRKCDSIFVFLESQDCLTAYGTLAEIGYAKALGKKVVIAGHYDPNQWFVWNMADIRLEGILDAITAFSMAYFGGILE